jgi:thiamine-phosphate pyrophosphorylase
MSLRGLYAIADTATLGADGDDAGGAGLDGAPDFDAAVTAALAGGARLVQYRDKTDHAERRTHQAAALVAACRRHGALALINDDPELAASSGADGVHVGGGDPDPGAARARLGPTAYIGVSCYGELERARAAQAAGADYIAFGRMYASATKAGGPHASLELLARAGAATGLPVCAIGGITVDRAPTLIAAGADLVAVVGDLFAPPASTGATLTARIEARAARYAGAFVDAAGPCQLDDASE